MSGYGCPIWTGRRLRAAGEGVYIVVRGTDSINQTNYLRLKRLRALHTRIIQLLRNALEQPHAQLPPPPVSSAPSGRLAQLFLASLPRNQHRTPHYRPRASPSTPSSTTSSSSSNRAIGRAPTVSLGDSRIGHRTNRVSPEQSDDHVPNRWCRNTIPLSQTVGQCPGVTAGWVAATRRP